MSKQQPGTQKLADAHAEADRELAERLALDVKGNANDPFKAAVEKVIPSRVTTEVTNGVRQQTIVSNKDRES